jgi:glycosyltransferase involved in cell wall biosynthesis
MKSSDKQNGGFIRFNQIADYFRKMGLTVEQFYSKDHSYRDRNGPNLIENLDNSLLSDYLDFYRDYEVCSKITSEPDLIFLEQPWLINEALALKSKFSKSRIVYSSHNIEWVLKRRILQEVNPGLNDQVIRDILTFERTAVRAADHVLAITNADAEHMLKFFDADSSKILIVANGTSYEPSKEFSPKEKGFCLVVGSAHPPLIDGTVRFLSDAAGWLPKNFDLVLAGSICDVNTSYWNSQKSLNRRSGVKLLGSISKEVLNQALGSATVIALPISYGGGSNLKTAEALMTGRPVVASRAAMRGFETYASAKNVSVTASPTAFKLAVVKYALQKPNTIERTFAKDLTWEYCLKNLAILVKDHS